MLMPSDPPVRRLLAITAEWRRTADIWEQYLRDTHGNPVSIPGGRGNAQNWVNWLRGCATQIEEVIAPDHGTGEKS